MNAWIWELAKQNNEPNKHRPYGKRYEIKNKSTQKSQYERTEREWRKKISNNTNQSNEYIQKIINNNCAEQASERASERESQ